MTYQVEVECGISQIVLLGNNSSRTFLNQNESSIPHQNQLREKYFDYVQKGMKIVVYMSTIGHNIFYIHVTACVITFLAV